MTDEMHSIIEKAKSARRNFVIGVGGGSSVGKSYYCNYLSTKLNQAGIEVIQTSLDNYQKGEDFLEKDTSLYRWDDPKNFDLFTAAKNFHTLKRGNAINSPIFDLKANRQTGFEKINPEKVILIDGLFLGFDEFKEAIDYSLYIESPFYSRFLRRIIRFHTPEKLQVPFKHMIKYVYLAHNTFVKPQAKKYDQTFTNVINIQQELMSYLSNSPYAIKHSDFNKKVYKELFNIEDVSFQIDSENGFYIIAGEKVLPIVYDISLKNKLQAIDWNLT